MTKFRSILLILIFIIIGCRQTEKNVVTSNQEIYDFMKIVIKQQNLDKKYGIRLNPETNFNHVESDSILFEKLLFEIEQRESKADSFDPNELYSYQLNLFSRFSPLTKEDIFDMKLQKEKLTSFQWDNSKLGFDLSNKQNWYSFSVPLFSKDKTKAIIMIKDLCSGLCGTGKTVLFTKENNNWYSFAQETWYH